MISSLPLLEDPWVFSQSHPLSTADVITEAKRRGVALDVATLREVYRRGDLPPLAEITARRVRTPVTVLNEPMARGSLTELRYALSTGRVRDPALEAFRPRLRFDSRKLTDPPRWTTGLIYSNWQLLALVDLRRRLTKAHSVGPRQRRRVVLPELDSWERARVEERRRWALVLMALEARYLPRVEPEWVSLVNVDIGMWHGYRATYDPAAVAASFAVTSEEVREYAERLLDRARDIDPMGDWAHLIRRAPKRTWRTLRGDALIALDHRIAAEVSAPVPRGFGKQRRG